MTEVSHGNIPRPYNNNKNACALNQIDFIKILFNANIQLHLSDIKTIDSCAIARELW